MSKMSVLFYFFYILLYENLPVNSPGIVMISPIFSWKNEENKNVSFILDLHNF